MSYHITYNDQTFTIEENETILDCLLRENANITYSCKAGACQSCMMQASEGELPANAQVGLKDTLKERKFFLSCQCIPQNDLVIKSPDTAGMRTKGRLIDISMLNHNVFALKIKQAPQNETQPHLLIEPGQFINLKNPHGITRSYSVANNPETDGHIELQVRYAEGGKMSEWLKTNASINDQVELQGPAGDCFYANGTESTASIYLAGTNTGLAPLYGIANQALKKAHKGKITLLHGVLTKADLYLVDELTDLANSHDNFEYIACVLNEEPTPQNSENDIQQSLLSRLNAPKPTDQLFLCGAPELVNSLKTKAFLKGLASKNIHSDPFLPSNS